MRPIAPRTGAPEQTVAEDQREYKPITVAKYMDEAGLTHLLTRWTMTKDERKRVAEGEDIYVAQVSLSRGMMPMIVQVGPGDYRTPVEGT